MLQWSGAAASACVIRNWVSVYVHETASAHRHTLMRACEWGDIILMFPDVVLHQFHIKAKKSGETARYKLLKQHNKTLQGWAACVSVRTCVLFTAVMAYLSLWLLTQGGYTMGVQEVVLCQLLRDNRGPVCIKRIIKININKKTTTKDCTTIWIRHQCYPYWKNWKLWSVTKNSSKDDAFFISCLLSLSLCLD